MSNVLQFPKDTSKKAVEVSDLHHELEEKCQRLISCLHRLQAQVLKIESAVMEQQKMSAQTDGAS